MVALYLKRNGGTEGRLNCAFGMNFVRGPVQTGGGCIYVPVGFGSLGKKSHMSDLIQSVPPYLKFFWGVAGGLLSNRSETKSDW
jgi:hypothetical protein